ncbi:MAG: hypothetical protein ACE145_06130 [Terriglobia bacterium]
MWKRAKIPHRALVVALLALTSTSLVFGAVAASTTAAIPAGTRITVQMIDAVDSKRNHVGEEFAAVLANPVVVENDVVIPKNAEARVRLTEAKTSGRIKGQSELELELVQVTVGGKTYSVDSSPYLEQGESRGKKSAKVIGGGAGLGAIIGAIAGGKKGAAVGGAVGAGAGTAVQASSHGEQVRVPSEAKVEFTLRSALTLNP